MCRQDEKVIEKKKKLLNRVRCMWGEGFRKRFVVLNRWFPVRSFLLCDYWD